MSELDELGLSQLTPEFLQKTAENDDLGAVMALSLTIDTEVTSISELDTMLPNLSELKLTAPSFLPSLRKIGTFMSLKVLWASAVGLESLDGASGMPNLTELYVSYNQITDLAPLAFLTKLEILDMESNMIESALDLRFLGLCPQLSNVTLRDCPIADLFDYRNVVQRRLPEGCLLDDGEDSRFSDSDSKLMNLEDANFIKELVADGLLDEDELLAQEPLSRPFTAIGIRPKSARATPRSPATSRPRTALNLFKKPSPNQSSSDLTKGQALQGSRGLLSHRRRSRPKSAGSGSQMHSNSVELDESKKLEIEEKLKSWTAENEEVNILKIDHEQFQTSHIPERSSLVRSIRTPPNKAETDQDCKSELEKDEGEPCSSNITLAREITPPSIVKRGQKSVTPADALSSTLRRNVLMFKSIKKRTEEELNSRPFRSRQEQLLAEGQLWRQVPHVAKTRTVTAPIIKQQSPSQKHSLANKN